MVNLKYVLGKDLRVGNRIKVWWEPNEDVITKLDPYSGHLTCWDKYPGKPRLATFQINRVGMTIEPQIMYEVIT